MASAAVWGFCHQPISPNLTLHVRNRIPVGDNDMITLGIFTL